MVVVEDEEEEEGDEDAAADPGDDDEEDEDGEGENEEDVVETVKTGGPAATAKKVEAGEAPKEAELEEVDDED